VRIWRVARKRFAALDGEGARQFGARETLNPRGIERVDKELKRRTGGGVDIALEVIGKPETLRAAYDSLRPGGRLCVVGYCAELVSLPFSKMMFFELEVVGSLGCRPGDYPELIQLVQTGRVKLAPLVTARYSLDEIFQGLDALLATVQMPGGVPVATMAIGKAGAKNAGVLAARILALQDEGLAKRLVEYRAGMAKDIEKKAKIIEERHKSTRRSDSESSR